MIEIGLMFYFKDFEKEIIPAIKRFKERMFYNPNTIYINDDKRGMIAGMKVKSSTLPKNHFVLAKERE